MLKIATHNSATGEKPLWWCFLLTPFAKCQSKTIKEQYDAGCRLFDIRVKKIGDKWRCAHGWWFTKRTVEDIINELNSFEDVCHVTLTFEGQAKNSYWFIGFVEKLKSLYKHITYGPVAVKYGQDSKGLRLQYDYVMEGEPNWIECPCQSKFMALNSRNWQTYIPIPWIWKKIYFNKPEFKEDIYTYVDFL